MSQSVQRGRDDLRIGTGRVDGISGVEKNRRVGNEMQPAALQQPAHDVQAEVSRAPHLEQVFAAERAETDRQRGIRKRGKGEAVLRRELGTPLDVNVSAWIP